MMIINEVNLLLGGATEREKEGGRERVKERGRERRREGEREGGGRE